MNRYIVKSKLFLYLTLTCTCCIFPLSTYADIYFNAKIAGPITNVSRIDNKGELHIVSPGNRQQDRGFSINKNGDIAYASNRPSKKDGRVQASMSIFIQSNESTKINPEKHTTEKIIQISETDEFSFSPQYSTDGKHLAYLSRDKENIHHLYLYNIKTKKQNRLLSASQIVDFMWSKNNHTILISLANDETSSIQTLSVTDKKTKTLIERTLKKEEKVKQKHKGSYLISATWSPDENFIAFIEHPLDRFSTKTANIYDIKTKKITQVSNSEYQVQSPISWRNDNKALIYSALIDYQVYYDEHLRDKVYKGGLHIFTTDLEGNTKKLTTGDHYHGKPVYSPDNTEIAFLFAEKLGGQLTYHLKKMDTSGNNLISLNESVFRESFLQWR